VRSVKKDFLQKSVIDAGYASRTPFRSFVALLRKIERGRALGFGVIERGGTGSAPVFQAISNTTLLEPVSLSARQRPCAIGESAIATFPRMQHARN